MGAWTEIVDYTVPSNTTSVVLNDFGTITKNDFIKIVATFVNASSSTNAISLFGNTATTATNYHRQQLNAVGTTVDSLRTNNSRYTVVFGNQTASVFSYLKLSENNRLNVFENENRGLTSTLANTFNYITSSGATFTSGITTLTFTSGLTDGIGTGSRIQIYRLDAVKEADITTTSNQTQVDISSLSIGKDSEYLLVSDIQGSTANTAALFVNDNTTGTNYYVQRIEGDGNAANAERFNGAFYASQAVAYSHIKLSEIGAYTSQNYGIRFFGTTAPEIQNYFVSSIAENITSITKLNVVSNVSDAIATGSRFILYKLK
jgi:hypothetical protein